MIQGDELDNTRNRPKTAFTNLSKIYRNPLFILTMITLVISIYLLEVQMKIGVPYWDVFNYLNNGLYFAGIDTSGNGIYLPPLLPLLTALLFKMGYVSINAIFTIDSILFIIGVIGLYLLLNERFNKIQSFTGSLIFISFPVILAWAAAGGIDIPGISFSILAIYLTVLGVKKNSKYLYFVIPLVILAFLMRYTAGLILLPIILYSLINIKQIDKIKKVVLGISLEIIALIGAFIYFLIHLGTITIFYNLLLNITTSSSTGVGDVAYNPNTWFYLQNMPNYISLAPFQGTYQQLLNPSNGFPSILAYITLLITFIGIILYIYPILSSKINVKKLNLNYFNIIKIVLPVILITGFILTLNNVSYIISEIIFFGICYVSFLLLKGPNAKNLDMDLLFFSWFLSYLIFQSALGIKVDRYFITMAPALAYFIILGFSEVINKISPMIKNKNLKSWGIYSLIALIFLSSAAVTYTGHLPKKTFTVDIGDASNWIKENDHNYKNKTIYSDYPPAVNWYLKEGINGAFPRFYNSSIEFSNFLQQNNVDYYIDSLSVPKPDLKGYYIIKNFGNVAIYKKN